MLAHFLYEYPRNLLKQDLVHRIAFPSGTEDVQMRVASFQQRADLALKARFVALFKTKTRDEWSALLEGSDVCFAPVLSLAEAARHPHNVARGTFTLSDSGAVQAAAAPRYLP